MTSQQSGALRGSLELLVLKALALEPRHGVGISQRIHQITGQQFQVSYGSLFPALHRMEEKGWLKAEWRTSENNRKAKFYRITPAGTRQLRSQEREWKQAVRAIEAALKSS